MVDEPAATLAWTSHPAKRRPQDVALAACVILGTAYAVLVSLRSPLLAGLSIVLLVVAILPFLVPTHYRVDAEHLEERRLFVRRSRAWAALRRLEIGPAAALVSPYREPRWLDRYRGLVIYLPAGDRQQRDAVIRALRERVAS